MRLALVGDIALYGRCTTPDYFKEVSDYLSQDDFVVGNLETPFSVKKKTYGAKSAYICANAECVQLLKSLHINAVTLANNHMFDFGKEGYETTKKLLEEKGIEWFGTEGKELSIERDGCKLAFYGFCCYTSNPLQAVTYGNYGVNEFSLQKSEELLRESVNKGFLPILSIHSGIEHVNYPSRETIDVAHRLAEVAPYIYYGHHPHVVQGIEVQNNSLIAYSLGNFSFDDVYSSASSAPLVKLSENNRSSVILEIEIKENKVVGYKTIPLTIGEEKISIGGIMTETEVRSLTNPILNLPPAEYKEMRSNAIKDYYGKRKAARNLSWFIKRLRWRYLMIMVNGRNNNNKYYRKVVEPLYKKK